MPNRLQLPCKLANRVTTTTCLVSYITHQRLAKQLTAYNNLFTTCLEFTIDGNDVIWFKILDILFFIFETHSKLKCFRIEYLEAPD